MNKEQERLILLLSNKKTLTEYPVIESSETEEEDSSLER